MAFRITGLDPKPFHHLFRLSETDLAAHGARRYVVDATPGFPDRVELRDGAIGETMLLLNHTHQPADTPYRASHAIYVREGATAPYDRANEIPEALRVRLLSLRSFDREGMMIDADVVEGAQVSDAIERFFTDPAAAYLHAHFARRGCYAARIDRT